MEWWCLDFSARFTFLELQLHCVFFGSRSDFVGFYGGMCGGAVEVWFEHED